MFQFLLNVISDIHFKYQAFVDLSVQNGRLYSCDYFTFFSDFMLLA